MSDTAIADPVTTTTGDLLDQFVELTQHKKDLEASLRMVKDELGPIAEQLLDRFAEEGVSGMRHAGTRKLVSVTRKLWARAAGDRAAAAAVLAEDPELGVYVEPAFNVNTLSAHFREQLKQRQEAGDPVVDPQVLVPEHLRDVITVTSDTTLSVRS